MRSVAARPVGSVLVSFTPVHNRSRADAEELSALVRYGDGRWWMAVRSPRKRAKATRSGGTSGCARDSGSIEPGAALAESGDALSEQEAALGAAFTGGDDGEGLLGPGVESGPLERSKRYWPSLGFFGELAK